MSDEDLEIVKIFSPLTDNLNAPNKDGFTPINQVAQNGHTEIVKILAPLTDNPNAPYEYGLTPIHMAAQNGHTEIVKILAPLTNNPNAPDRWGNTPIHMAAKRTEISDKECNNCSMPKNNKESVCIECIECLDHHVLVNEDAVQM